MDFKAIGGKCVDWIQLPQGEVKCRALVNIVQDFWVPRKVANFLFS